MLEASHVGEGYGACRLALLSEPAGQSLLPSAITAGRCLLVLERSGRGPGVIPGHLVPKAHGPGTPALSGQDGGDNSRELCFLSAFKGTPESPVRPTGITLITCSGAPWSLPTLPPFLGEVPRYNLSQLIEPYNSLPSDKH